MAVAKHHGRGPHLILIGEFGETAKLLDNSNVWKAIEALAQFIEDNYEGDGCYGAKGTGFDDSSKDSAAIKLLKSMDLPSLAYA